MPVPAHPSGAADLLVTGAKLVATCDAGRRELPGGWVAVTGGQAREMVTGPSAVSKASSGGSRLAVGTTSWA